MPFNDLRDFLIALEKEEELIRVTEPLDPRYEVAALLRILSEHESYPGALIENVKGYSVPVAGNLFGSKKRAALALEANEGTVEEAYLRRKQAPISPQTVSAGPVKDVLFQNDLDLAQILPVLTYHERDAGPYMTQGVVFLKDPQGNHQTMGIHRIRLKDENLISIAFESKTSNEYLHRAEQDNVPLEVVVALGLDPALIMAAVAWFPFGDKLALAGGLRTEPVDIIPAETVDIQIPAHAMFVLEGLIRPHSREPEGPFGESTGYYITLNSPVAEIQSISHQKNPIYPVFLPSSLDDGIPLGICWSSEVLASLQKDFPSVVGVNFNVLNASVVVSITGESTKDPRKILQALLSAHPYAKNAIIVNDDIDIFNPRDVEWALGTRFQPGRDLVLIDRAKGSPIDPSCEEVGVSSKMGLDATKPSGKEEKFERARASKDHVRRAKELLKKYIS